MSQTYSLLESLTCSFDWQETGFCCADCPGADRYPCSVGWPGIHSLDYGGTYWLCSVETLVETDFLYSVETGCLCSEVTRSCFEDSPGATHCPCFLGWQVRHFLCFLLDCEFHLLTHSYCCQRVKDFDSLKAQEEK